MPIATPIKFGAHPHSDRELMLKSYLECDWFMSAMHAAESGTRYRGGDFEGACCTLKVSHVLLGEAPQLYCMYESR